MSDPRIHPITGMRLEDGFGKLSDDDQALVLHCAYIEQVEGKEAADAMREKLHDAMTAPEPEAPIEQPEQPDEAEHAPAAE